MKQLVELAPQLLQEGLSQLTAHRWLTRLVSRAPSRLVGSDGYARAETVAMALMEEAGLQNVRRQETEVRLWDRGQVESLERVGPAGPSVTFTVAALGGSDGTAPEGVVGEVVRVTSFEEMDALGTEAIRDRIVFFDARMPSGSLDTFASYGEVSGIRYHGAARAAKLGACAVLTRSITTRRDDVPHTGIMGYEKDGVRIPAASLGWVSSDRLAKLLEREPGTVLRLRLSARNLGTTTANNIIGDWPGSRLPKEIVLLSGHLDSWDLGVGAHDDASGCVHALEAVRLLRSLGLAPARTLRVVWFANEEFGGYGGLTYAKAARSSGEKHVLAVESDRGGFTPKALTVKASEETVQSLASYLPAFSLLGIESIGPGYGGVDIRFLEEDGVPLVGLVPDSQRYFDVHHSANDQLSEVNPRELELGAIVLAMVAWIGSEVM